MKTKKIIFGTGFAFMLLVFAFFSCANADEGINLDLNVEIINQQSQGQANSGSGSRSGNGSGGKSESKYEGRSKNTFTSIPGTSHHLSPRVIYDPNKNKTIWKEASIVEYDRLYHDIEELINIMKTDKDIFQSVKKIFSIGNNNNNINILRKIPKNAKLLFPFVIDSPTNGFYWETIVRGCSIGKILTGTNNILISTEPLLNSFNRSSSKSTNFGGSGFIDEISTILSFGYTDGEGESLIYKREKIYFYCYGAIETESANKPAKTIKNDNLYSFMFGPEGIESNNKKLEKIAKRIAQKWDQVRPIVFQGSAPEELNREMLDKYTTNAMIGIGRALFEMGISEEILENKLSYDLSVISDIKTVSKMKQKGAIGFIIISQK